MTSRKVKKPEELQHIWCDEVADAFTGLNQQQRKFILLWFSGKSGSDSWRDAYKKPTANAKLASSSSSQVFGSIGISRIMAVLNKSQAYELIKAKRVYIDAMEATKPVFKDGEMILEVEDHPTRINAAEKLTKLNGQIVDKSQLAGDPEKPLFQTIERIIVKAKAQNNDT